MNDSQFLSSGYEQGRGKMTLSCKNLLGKLLPCLEEYFHYRGRKIKLEFPPAPDTESTQIYMESYVNIFEYDKVHRLHLEIRHSEVKLEKAINKFHEVFRRKVRETLHYVLMDVIQETLKKACSEANKIFRSFVPKEDEPDGEQMLTMLETRVRQGFYVALSVNHRKRIDFLKTLETEAIDLFQNWLDSEFPFDNGVGQIGKFYDSEIMLGKTGNLVSQTVEVFRQQIPIGEVEIDQLCKDLEVLLHKMGEALLEKNIRTHITAARMCGINEVLQSFNGKMSTFITKHPLPSRVAVRQYHNGITATCFWELATRGKPLGVGEVLQNKLRDELGAKMLESYENLVKKWEQDVGAQMTACHNALTKKVNEWNTEGEQTFENYGVNQVHSADFSKEVSALLQKKMAVIRSSLFARKISGPLQKSKYFSEKGLPFSIYFAGESNKLEVLVPKNAKFPIIVRKTISIPNTSQPGGEDRVILSFYEGEDPATAKNALLGELWLRKELTEKDTSGTSAVHLSLNINNMGAYHIEGTTQNGTISTKLSLKNTAASRLLENTRVESATLVEGVNSGNGSITANLRTRSKRTQQDSVLVRPCSKKRSLENKNGEVVEKVVID